MVRLKVDPESSQIAVMVISIPYGAIKRKQSLKKQYFDSTFQFLMVRLKAELIKFSVSSSQFQFLMVRLKVMNMR